jgi:hypothetical protein
VKREKREKRMTQDVALPTDYETGLEDFDASSAGLPRVHIKHQDGVFADRQTNEEFSQIHGVFLGMIKQRVMWAKDLEDDSKPLCKSNDGEFGYPNITGPKHSLFPWALSAIDPQTVPTDEHGRPTIKCETCPFTQWVRTAGKNTPPACSERYTMPMHFATEADRPYDHAGIISFQRSGITPIKNFIAAFARTHQPLFSAGFKLVLETNKRGQVVYSVPKIQRTNPVPQENWPEYATEYRGVREMLRRMPAFNSDDDDSTPASNNNWNAKPAQQPVNAIVTEDPWATSNDQPAQAWPAAAAGTTGAVMTGSLVDAASTPIVQPTQTVSAVSASTPSVAADDDDLPF